MIEATLDESFGTREVLVGAKLAVRRGTVHALVGENGAGKSTLVRIVAGVIAGQGTLVVAGAPAQLSWWTRRAARARGLGIVQQHGAFAGARSGERRVGEECRS